MITPITILTSSFLSFCNIHKVLLSVKAFSDSQMQSKILLQRLGEKNS